MSNKNKKIIIIGGGLIGSSIAWNLCKIGYHPTIIEKKYSLDDSASASCEGLMLLQSKKPGTHLSMAMKSIDLYEQMQNELDIDIEFKRTGGLVLIHSKKEMDILNDYVAKQKSCGADIEMLNANQIKELVPQVASDIQGGSFSKKDSVINPLNLTYAWQQDCKKRGATLLQNTEVLKIIQDGGRVKKVVTDKGDFETDLVINAAGPYGGKIANLVHLDIPLKPRKGEVMITRASKNPVLKYALLSATYIAAKYDPEIAKSGTGFAIDQSHNGNILIGSTREFVDFHQTSTIKGMNMIAKSINKTLPGLGDLNIIRCFAGLRPYTPDGLPFLGEHPKVKGFFFACGHEGDGVTLAAVTGKIVSDLIDGKTVEYDMSHFSPGRFDQRGA